MTAVRRGSALILVLMMTLAVAGLAIAAIFMSSSAGLLSAFYDREREYRLASEAGLEIVRSRLTHDSTLAIPDTGMRQLLAGYQIANASGALASKVRVNVFAAATGDTSGLRLPTVTLVAASYDANGTRHVRRMDLRRESFSRYQLFVDSFPSGLTHGPTTVSGRVHSNGSWRSSTGTNIYRDTVTAVVDITGAGTFDVDSIVGVQVVAWPRDSTYPRLDTIAAAAGLSFDPVSGGTRGSRLEFVAFDADGDATVEPAEGFARIFDLASGGYGDTVRLRASPVTYTFFGTPYFAWDDPIIQRQCGAFYLRGGRWSFVPVASHRIPWVTGLVQSMDAGDYPLVASTAQMDDYDYDAVELIMGNQATARCYPAGSPFLMLSERMTDDVGVITGGAADTVPFGIAPVPGGWPVGALEGYGGSDTTFTPRSRNCRVLANGAPGGMSRCEVGTTFDVGTWRAFPSGPVVGISAGTRQATEVPYLWALSPPWNAVSRGAVSARSGPLYLSGSVRGHVTLRVAGRVVLVDRLAYQTDANDPTAESCTDRFGLLAQGDVLVAESPISRVRMVFSPADFDLFTFLGRGERHFAIQGSIMSTTGTVGTEAPSASPMGASGSQLRCPETGGINSSGGCLAITGGLAMKTYSRLYNSGTTNSGFRYRGTSDRCQATTNRPPFFPLTNRYTFVRTLEVEPSRANTPTKIRTMLLRLKGKAL